MRPAALLLSLAAFAAGSGHAQTAGAPESPAYARTWEEMLHRAADNHSPTQEEIAAAGSPATQPDAAAVAQALPSIRKALLSPDASVRTYALTALNGLEIPPPAPSAAAPPASSQPNAPAASTQPRPDATLPAPATFAPKVSDVLAAAIPEIARNLTDDASTDRILAAVDLGGFAPNPPPAVYPPLLAYLKRDDGIGPAGVAVVDDLLQLSPVSPATANALIAYLRRNDQTADSRSSLIDSVSSHANQSQAVNQALLSFLNTDDPAVRARLILSLPQLDLAPEVFSDTRSLIAVLATNNQENLQVVNAAKAVTTCWTAVRMPAGCPVY